MKTLIPSNPATLQRESKNNVNTFNTGFFSSLVMKMAVLFSSILEEEISPRQALCLLHSMLAFTAMVFPVDMALLLRFCLIAWFGVTLLQCRQAGLGGEREA